MCDDDDDVEYTHNCFNLGATGYPNHIAYLITIIIEQQLRN